MLKIGLMLGALGFLWVSWASWSAGYPVEIATVRGLLAFMAMCVVGYFGELVVSTAAPAAEQAADGAATAGSGRAEARPAEPASSGRPPQIREPIVGVPAVDEAEAVAELEPAA